MANRCMEPGWLSIALHDPASRRGVWARLTRRDGSYGDGFEAHHDVAVIELCAGREGDDAYARLELGQLLNERNLASLWDVMITGMWILESHESLVQALARQRCQDAAPAGSRE